MRLDKYLKVSRIIKRRTVANEACSGGRVTLNGKVAKPGAEVKPGDIMTIRFGDHLGRYEILAVSAAVTATVFTLGARTVKARVVSVNEYAKKDEAAMMYEIIEEK